MLCHVLAVAHCMLVQSIFVLLLSTLLHLLVCALTRVRARLEALLFRCPQKELSLLLLRVCRVSRRMLRAPRNVLLVGSPHLLILCQIVHCPVWVLVRAGLRLPCVPFLLGVLHASPHRFLAPRLACRAPSRFPPRCRPVVP